MVITIPDDKLREIITITDAWSRKKSATRREYQILAGKLNHVALCILPAHRFMGRILTALRNSPQTGYTTVPRDVNLDIAWFSKYAEACNGRYLLRPITEKFYIECDACLEGGGGGGRILLACLLQHRLSPRLGYCSPHLTSGGSKPPHGHQNPGTANPDLH